MIIIMNKPKALLLIYVSVQCVCPLYARYTPIVELSQGKLRGIRGLNGQNQYFGIPYGFSKRFQPPTPPKVRSGIFDAVHQYESCAQAIGTIHLGVEDCNKLDIYTPGYASRGHKLPVLIFFHGGAYFNGAKWNYDAEFLVEKDVVVVVVNYRLGVLGFLCLNNVANLGLKDQLAALKWVQKNIAAFGGDPDNVTVSGQSAGAASSSMHFLSKKSKGLFHKAILISGVALLPWAFTLNPLNPAFTDAAKINRNFRNEVDAFNIFQNASLDDLLAATHDRLVDPKYFKYAPCGDTNFTDPFFHDTPYNIIKSGDFTKVPTIIGFTDLEGMLFYGSNTRSTLQNLEDNFTDRLPSTFSWCSDKDQTKIAGKIRAHYFGKQKINSKATMKAVVDFYSDWIAYSSIDAFSKLMAKYSDKPIYNYMFSYEGERNFPKLVSNAAFGLKGATHCDDLAYLYKPLGLTLKLNSLDRLIIDRFTTMFTNFMKFGDPTPSTSKLLPIRWPVTTANRSQVMRIDHPLSVTDTPPRVRGDFFLSLLCKYGQNGYVPCDSAMQCNL